MYTWGIIGSDLIAEDFIATLLQHHRSCKIAMCKDQNIKDKYKELVFYDSLDELINDKEIQIIYISTHTDQHQEIIMRALQTGKHILGEKPLFLNAKDAKIAYQYAKEQNVFLGEANTIYYMPIYEEINHRIKNNEIGTLKMIRCDFGSLKDEDNQSPLFRKDKAGGALYDIGIYALTAVLQFLGTNVEVKASVIPHQFGVDEGWCIMLKNEKNQLASITLSLRSKLDKRLLIAGDKGFIEVMNYPRGDCYDVVDPKMFRTTYTNGKTKDAVWYEIENVERMVKTHNYIGSRAELNYSIMLIMDKIREELMLC